jgi:6-phosphogluconolactonase
MTGMRKVVAAEEFAAAAAEWIRRKIDEVLRQSEKCHLMLAGGATPLPVYECLAGQADLPWARLKIYFGDERCVPLQAPENNAYTVISRLFPNGVPRGVEIHRMNSEEDPDKAAQAYAAALPPQLDILLLGIGDDGHTASIFPGSAALDEESRRVMPVIGSKAPLQRLTITPPVIRQARHLLMMVQGEEKADAVRWALHDGSVPAALAAGGDWLLDRYSARSLLHGQDNARASA